MAYNETPTVKGKTVNKKIKNLKDKIVDHTPEILLGTTMAFGTLLSLSIYNQSRLNAYNVVIPKAELAKAAMLEKAYTFEAIKNEFAIFHITTE